MEALPRIVVWVISVFDPRRVAMKSGPLTKRRYLALEFGVRKILSLPRAAIGRRHSLLKTAQIGPVWVLGIRYGFHHPLRPFAMFEHLRTFSVLRARRLPMLIRHRVARQATG